MSKTVLIKALVMGGPSLLIVALIVWFLDLGLLASLLVLLACFGFDVAAAYISERRKQEASLQVRLRHYRLVSGLVLSPV